MQIFTICFDIPLTVLFEATIEYELEKSVLSIALITGTNMFLSIFLLYSAAVISSIAIDVALCVLLHRHYIYQTTKRVKLLISDIEVRVGLDNCVSTPIVTEFQDYAISEDKIWEGVPIASRDTSIEHSGGAMKVEDDWILFVSWTSYSGVNDRIKDDCAIIEELTKRNDELRMEILRQNERIFHMRTKFKGPYPDCADIREVPIWSPPVESWNAEQAAGLFVYCRGEVNSFVNIRDFRNLAKHAALVRKSIGPLKEERRQLAEGLERRRLLIDGKIMKLLKYINEMESRKSEVRIQLADDH